MNESNLQKTNGVKLKRRWSIVLGLTLCTILLLISIACVVVALADFQHGEVPTVFGWGISSSNGEYEPIVKNAAILMKRVDNPDQIAKGDVVLFYYEGARSDHKVYAGQVLENDASEKELYVYINEELDEVAIHKDVVRGEVHYYVRHVGYLLGIIEDRYGVILSVALVVLLVSVMILLVGSYISVGEQRRVATAINDAAAHVKATRADAEQDDDGLREPIDPLVPVRTDALAVAIDKATTDAAAETALATDTGADTPSPSETKEVTVADTTPAEPEDMAAIDIMAEAKEQTAAVQEAASVPQDAFIQPDAVKAAETEAELRNLSFPFTVPEATLLQRLLSIAAQRQEKSNIVATVDESLPGLLVVCSAEAEPYVNGVVAAFARRRRQRQDS